MWRRTTIALAVLALLLIGVWQYHNIRDWWILRSYNPPPEISALAQNTTMTSLATREFYLAQPDLENKQSFSQNCPVGELSLVLGCYNGSRIYVLKVEKPELAKVMEVTAAHEMLHAAYADLSDKQRQEVNGLLENYYTHHASPKLQELIAEYDKAQPGTRLNELHSLVGTQEKSIGPELEAYYARYFQNRQTVVNDYLAYEGVFNSIQANLQGLESTITSLKSQLDSLEKTIDSLRTQLDQVNSQLDAYQAADNISAYNSLVPTQNSLVNQYNTSVNKYKSLVAQHNAKVEQYNQTALQQNELVNSLDASKFTPVPN